MIKKLFIKRALSLVAAAIALVSISANAQPTVLTTSAPGRVTFITVNPAPNAISFDVENNNNCPYKLTDLSMLHGGLVPFAGGINFSSNDCVYTLWSHPTKQAVPQHQ